MATNLKTAKNLFSTLNDHFGNVYYIDQRMGGHHALMRINEHNLSRSDGYLIVCDPANEDLYDELDALNYFIDILSEYFNELAGEESLCQDYRFTSINGKLGRAYDIERGEAGDYRLIHHCELQPDETEVVEDCPQDEDLYDAGYAARYYSEYLEDYYNELHKG